MKKIPSVPAKTAQKSAKLFSANRKPRKNAMTALGPRWACVNAAMIAVATGNGVSRPLNAGPNRSAADVKTKTKPAAATIRNARSQAEFAIVAGADCGDGRRQNAVSDAIATNAS